MVKWTEVNAYSGMPVEEDAPTNSAGSGKVAMPPDAMMKKKKKTFLDARTKAYKEHQKKLEASRQRREERKKNAAKMNEGQISEMKKVEITLNNPNDAKKIQKDVIDLTNKKRKVNITMKQMGKKLIIDGGDYDINREVKDIRNFIGFKSAKVVEDIQPMTFSQKIKEQVTAFGRESFLAENNMDVIRSVNKSGQHKDLKMKDGKIMMDTFSASAIMQVYDNVNPTNKKRMEGLANGKKSDLLKLQALALKVRPKEKK